MRDIFVFGSNLAGRHGKGAAKTAAEQYGAIYGNGIGIQGRSYAIPTKNSSLKTLPIPVIAVLVRDFMDYAIRNPDDVFRVTKIGTGLAGYREEQIAPMFRFAPSNCILPDEWEYKYRDMGTRILIAGSRSVKYSESLIDRISNIADKIITDPSDTIELCGLARGADSHGRTWALRDEIIVSEYPALWDVIDTPNAHILYGKGRPYNSKAGHDRNAMMMVGATHAIIIWSVETPGTRNMLKLIKDNGITYYEIKP